MNPDETILSPSTVSGLKELWAAPIGTPVGLSSPSVVDGVVYIASFDGFMRAFDADTGAAVWAIDLGDAIEATPAVDEGRLFTVTNDGAVFALDAATGSAIWTASTNRGVSAMSVHDGVVYQTTLSDVRAYDAASGALLWTHFVQNSSLSSPSVRGNLAVITSGMGWVYALNAHTGGKRWAVNLSPDRFQVSTPSLANGLVYVGTINTDTAYALSQQTGEVVWKTNVGDGWFDSSPAVTRRAVYLADLVQNKVWAFDASTGKRLWAAQGGGSQNALALANGVLYSTSFDGNVYAFDARTGDVLWEGALGGIRGSSSPAVSRGRLYVGSEDGFLHAFGL